MGYGLSRFELEEEMPDMGPTSDGDLALQEFREQCFACAEDFPHITKYRTSPSEIMLKITATRSNRMVPTFKMLLAREINYTGKGGFSSKDCCHVLSRYLPTFGPWHVDRLHSRAYVSQFSADGSLFVAGFQSSNIRIYNVEKNWKIQKDIHAKSLRWTITDTSLSPDQKYLVYSSLTPLVHIVNVGSSSVLSHANITEIHEGLDFSDEESFGIFSVKFSTDGRELVAGTNDNSIYVYDLTANRLSLQLNAHESDVNTVTFGDESGHLIYSGSDDHLCKVWDRRCIARGQPAGILVGHLQGITFLDSRGDGRYFISNGKDQVVKLWDIRKMSSNATHVNVEMDDEWDYRVMNYHARGKKHPGDQSLASYSGHSVLRTLIRCYFSPAYSTGQKYIYTGSYDSNIYIYDVVTGDLVNKLVYHESTVRDCCWHPVYPILVSSSWDGSVARWEFPGNDKAPVIVRRRSRRRNSDYY